MICDLSKKVDFVLFSFITASQVSTATTSTTRRRVETTSTANTTVAVADTAYGGVGRPTTTIAARAALLDTTLTSTLQTEPKDATQRPTAAGNLYTFAFYITNSTIGEVGQL